LEKEKKGAEEGPPKRAIEAKLIQKKAESKKMPDIDFVSKDKYEYEISLLEQKLEASKMEAMEPAHTKTVCALTVSDNGRLVSSA